MVFLLLSEGRHWKDVIDQDAEGREVQVMEVLSEGFKQWIQKGKSAPSQTQFAGQNLKYGVLV